MSYNSNIPAPGVPVVGPDGRMAPAWFQFFITLFQRTGGLIGQDANSLQVELASGHTQPDLAPLASLLMSVEALAMEALASSRKQQDERGESGDGALLAGLLDRIAHLENSIDNLRTDGELLRRVADLEAKAEALGAPSPAPAGYDTTTINGNTRSIAYY